MCPALAKLKLSSNRIIKLVHSHIHSPQLLKEAARAEERRMITAAAMVGAVSTKAVCSRIKANIEGILYNYHFLPSILTILWVR